MLVWNIIFLSKWGIGRFHVNLPGCKPLVFHWYSWNTNIPLFLHWSTHPARVGIFRPRSRPGAYEAIGGCGQNGQWEITIKNHHEWGIFVGTFSNQLDVCKSKIRNWWFSFPLGILGSPKLRMVENGTQMPFVSEMMKDTLKPHHLRIRRLMPRVETTSSKGNYSFACFCYIFGFEGFVSRWFKVILFIPLLRVT